MSIRFIETSGPDSAEVGRLAIGVPSRASDTTSWLYGRKRLQVFCTILWKVRWHLSRSDQTSDGDGKIKEAAQLCAKSRARLTF
jgi:hypothetical protein